MKIEKKEERELTGRCFTKGDLSLNQEDDLFHFFIKISLGTSIVRLIKINDEYEIDLLQTHNQLSRDPWSDFYTVEEE